MKADIDIFPSLLEETPDLVYQFLHDHHVLFSHFQIDIADGLLVDGKTYSVDDWVEYIFAHPSSLLHTIPCEFHLMVQDFIPDIHTLATLGEYMDITRTIIHLEALTAWYTDPGINYYEALKEECSDFDYGIAIQADSNVSAHISQIMAFPLVQIMTVEPGGQGRPFNLKALKHLETLDNASFSGSTQLDGGINDITFPEVLAQQYLPNAVCPGSFLKDNTEDHYDKLKEMLQ